ncbi:MAG: peptide chain release factor 1 [Dehalococcoidales bacterium]|nr:peptide chain release factor 1 [Dehalococcoidales bacterium]
MLNRLKNIEKHYLDLEQQIAMPETASDLQRLQVLAKERASIENLVTKYRQYVAISKSLEEAKTMLNEESDEDMITLTKQEIDNLEPQLEQLFQELRVALLPKDSNDDRDIIMEIRAGAGGDEAGLFAADLFRMYSRYAQSKGWEIDIVNLNESGIGAIKEIVFEVKGKGAFSRLKYEMGVHRVQRVPATESSGRIHTSTATVAVLPQADEVEVSINPDDLKIDIFHSGGAGGQNVNKVATAVRITHFPTGIVTICQDERSQLRNKLKAMSVLRARLLDLEQRKQDAAITKQRRSQVGTGDRAEKIRTYNFPQDRLSDHRINLSLRNLPRILEGNLDELINSLTAEDQSKQLEAQLT